MKSGRPQIVHVDLSGKDAALQIGGLDEAARALVYIPLGSLFGMSLNRD